MLQLTAFILACYGMTMIAVYGKIFNNVREKIRCLKIQKLNELIECPLCVGFWAGCAMSMLISVPFGIFVAGCIGAGSSYLLCSIVEDEGIAVKIKRD